jgi:hypothetical protein
MKTILLLSGLLIFASHVSGQQLMNVKRNGLVKPQETNLSGLLKQRNDLKKKVSDKSDTSLIDVMGMKYLSDMQEQVNESINDIIIEMENEPDLTISGFGGVSNLENVGKAGGNFSICATFKLGHNKRVGNSYWIDPPYLYLAFNTQTHSSSDTSVFSRAFLFPEISKRDFIIGTFLRFTHAPTNWEIKPTAEFSLNRYNAADSTSPLRTESFLIGAQFSKSQTFTNRDGTSIAAGFQLFPYYNLIHTQEKNLKYLPFPQPNLFPRSLHTIGIQAILQVSALQLFANVKYILSDTKTAGVDDLIGMTYTIGTVINVDILAFDLGF